MAKCVRDNRNEYTSYAKQLDDIDKTVQKQKQQQH